MKLAKGFLTVLLAAKVLLAGAIVGVRVLAEETALEGVFAAAVKRAGPSVVSITVEWNPGKKFVPPAPGRPGFERGTGPVAGVIISPDGLIVTSDFNVNADAKRVMVKLGDSREFEAKLLGRDVSRGLQLLQIDAKGLPVPPFAEDSRIRVGRWALVCGVGETPADPSLSVGIVSATDRLQGRAIQIDASTNPSNYGGPLVDIEGRVMGIVTPLTPAGTGGGVMLSDSGVGFAVPVSDVLEHLAKLKAGETIRSAFLGIRFDTRTMSGGAKVVEVLKDTGAAAAGIRPGDLIVEFNGEPIQTSFKLLHAIGRCRVDDVVKFTVVRDGKRIERTATMGARPESTP